MLLLTAMPGIIPLLIYILIFCILVAVIWWLVNKFLPEPLKGFATAIIVVICAIVLILLLLQVAGSGGLRAW